MKADSTTGASNPASKTVAGKRAAKRQPAPKLSERQQRELWDALKRFVRDNPTFDVQKI